VTSTTHFKFYPPLAGLNAPSLRADLRASAGGPAAGDILGERQPDRAPVAARLISCLDLFQLCEALSDRGGQAEDARSPRRGEVVCQPQRRPRLLCGHVDSQLVDCLLSLRLDSVLRLFCRRACYEEGKRVAETMMYAYQAQGNVQVRVSPRASYDGAESRGLLFEQRKAAGPQPVLPILDGNRFLWMGGKSVGSTALVPMGTGSGQPLFEFAAKMSFN
jgi:hypothetical protein